MSDFRLPVIILQYGNFQLTEKCIETVRQQNIDAEIILVDGNSPHRDAKNLKKLGELADRRYFLDQNLGYAGANNIAIKALLDLSSPPPFFMVLNNDTELQAGCLASLLAAAKEYPDAAQLCPRVMYGSGELQAAGGYLYKPLFEPRLLGHLENVEAHTSTVEVDFAPGMAVLVRTAAVLQAGLIPERYFMYGEDVDWSLTLASFGWKCRYVPEASLTHFESASIGSYNRKKAYYLTRSNVLLARKWLSEEEWPGMLRKIRAKLLRHSLKLCGHPAYVKGMWEGFRAGREAE